MPLSWVTSCLISTLVSRPSDVLGRSAISAPDPERAEKSSVLLIGSVA